jgi:cadmium resistance protein CadD (predicted permease)
LLIDALAVIGLVAGSFAATNVDNLALLVSWLISGRGNPTKILAGYTLGMLALLIVACLFGLGANLVPERYVGYLGIIPIALGLKGLYELFRATAETEVGPAPSTNLALIFSIATTQLANGIDTVLVFGPLLADSELGVDFMMIGGFVVMVLVWFRLARFLEFQASRIAIIERYSHWISPIVLIVIGLYIMDNSATDVLAGE